MPATLFWLKLFIGFKYISMFNDLVSLFVITFARFFASRLRPYPSKLINVLMDLSYFYLWALPYTIPSFSNLTTFILLYRVGTNYDPGNPFLSVMLFLLPVLMLVPRLGIFTFIAD